MKRGMKGRASALMISRSWSAQCCFAGAFSRPKQTPGEGLSAAAVQDKRPECIFAGALFFSLHSYLFFHLGPAGVSCCRRCFNQASQGEQLICAEVSGQIKPILFWQGEQNARRDLFFSFEGDSPHLTKHNR